MSSLYRVTDTAPLRVNGAWVQPGDILSLSEAEALYERDLGHVEAVTAEADPADLTDAERADLTPLGAGEGDAILAESQWLSPQDEHVSPGALDAFLGAVPVPPADSE